jgi:hypothetical protein
MQLDESTLQPGRALGNALLSFTPHGWKVYLAMGGTHKRKAADLSHSDADADSLASAAPSMARSVARTPGSRPRGRPRKHPVGESKRTVNSNGSPPPVARKRGRPRSSGLVSPGTVSIAPATHAGEMTLSADSGKSGNALARGSRAAAGARGRSGVHREQSSHTVESVRSASGNASFVRWGHMAPPPQAQPGGGPLGRQFGNFPLARGLSAQMAIAPAEHFNDLSASPVNHCLGDVLASVQELSRYYEARISSLESEVELWKRVASQASDIV